MSPNEVHTKVVQELFDSKILGTSQNPAKEIQKLKDLVNLQYSYDTGNAPSASQHPTTKSPPVSGSSAPSASKQSAATKRPTSTSSAPSASKSSTATRPPTSTSGEQSSRDHVQELYADRARKLKTEKKRLEAAEKTEQKAKKQSTATRPPSSTSDKQSSRDPVQDLFADRARKLETEKKEKEAAEKAERKAEALAKKEATSLPQTAAISKQGKYAREEKERLAEEKMEKERVLKKIEADKVERKEREERRKETAKIEADEASRGPTSNRPKTAYTTATMPRPMPPRPNTTFSNRSHQSNIRPPGSQVPPQGRSLASRQSTAGISQGEHLDGDYADEEYPDDEGYSDQEYFNQDYSEQDYYPRRNNSNQKPSQRRPSPRSFTRENTLADQSYVSPPLPRSGSSRPFSSEGIRLGGPKGPPAYSYTQPSSFLPTRAGPPHRSILPFSPRAGPSTRSSRPFPQPRRNNIIEGFDLHESAREDPTWSHEMTKSCLHPRYASTLCSHCDRGISSVCMPCVVRGCKGKWCSDCWDAMVERKRVMGARVVRPPGWQECPYRPKQGQGGPYRPKQDQGGVVHRDGWVLRPL